MTMRVRSIAAVFVAVCVFIISLIIFPYYFSGDQEEYRNVYEHIGDLNFADAYWYYWNWTGAKEYIHFFIVWIASGWGVDKDILMSLANGLFAYLAMRLFEKWRVSLFVAMATILTNFYMVMMYFAAERLKFGFIFLVISMLYINSKRRFFPIAVLAVLAHAQIVIVYGSMLFARVTKAALKFLHNFRFTFTLSGIFLPLLMIVPIVLLGEKTLDKIEFYQHLNAGKGAADFIRIIVLLIMSWWYSNTKKETFLLFIPLLLIISIVGSDRVNMIGYFIFLYYGLQYKRGLNFGVLATTVYFAFKSYVFVSDVIEYGDGFATMVSQFDVISRAALA